MKWGWREMQACGDCQTVLQIQVFTVSSISPGWEALARNDKHSLNSLGWIADVLLFTQ